MINFALWAGTFAVALLTHPGGGSAPTSPVTPGPVSAMTLAATADSFSPAGTPKKKRRAAPARPRPAGSPARERAPGTASEGGGGQTPPRRRPAPAPAEDEGTGESADGEEEEDEEERPKPKRRVVRKSGGDDEESEEDGGDEEDEEEDDAPMASLPPVLPRLFSFGLGGSLMGRTFAFNQPLQKESTFPRLGFKASLETYPLIRRGRGWYRKLGLGVDFAMEFGAAALKQPSGLTVSFPVSQRRYVIDVRYAIVAGERVVILPAIGIGNNTFTLKTNTPVPPSMCNAAIAMPCITGVQATYLQADLHLRIALTDATALTLSGGYLMGLAVGQGAGQIGQERAAKMSGYHGELAGLMMMNDWVAVRVGIPFLNYSYTFSGGTGGATYTSAAETYFGGTISALLFTR